MVTKRKRSFRERAAALCHHYLEVLGLHKSWTLRFKFDDEFVNPDGDVETSWPEGYRSGTIRIRPNLETYLDPMNVRRAMCHEVMHLYFADLSDAVWTHLGPHSPGGHEIRREIEKVIDGLSTLLVKELKV